MRQFITVCLMLMCTASFGQFVTIGPATPIAPLGCFRLNPDVENQLGYVWVTNQIDLSQPFEISCELFFGFNDGGADGVSFIFQQIGTTATGQGAGGIGYQGINNSVALEFDTFTNGWDSPAGTADHLAVMINGIQDHTNGAGNLAGPVDILATSPNAEDGMMHDVNIIWNPLVDSMRIYVDCNLRLELQYDFVANVFGGNPMVYVGAAGATGGARNQHRFCLKDVLYNLDTLYTCAGDTISLDAGPGTAYNWASTYNISSNNTRLTEVWPTVDTTYLVVATDSCGFPSRRLFTVITTDPATIDPNLGNDISFCDGSSFSYDVSRPEVSQYLWQDSSMLPTFTVDTAGIFWVELTNICGTQRDSVTATLLFPPTVDLGPDDTLCQGTTRLLDLPIPNAAFTWQDNPMFNDSTFLVNQAGVYTVVVVNSCGAGTDTIEFFEGISPSVDLGADTTICDQTDFVLDATTVSNATYMWQDMSTMPTFTATQSGEYSVSATNLCGSVSDTINLTFDQRPVVELGNDTSFCEGNTLTLDVTWTPGSSYIWQNGDTSSVITATVSSLYEVIVFNGCGFDRDSLLITVIEAPVPGFLQDSSLLCDGMEDTLRTGYSDPIFSHEWNDLSTDSILLVSDAGTYSVRVFNECGSAEDQTVVTASISPLVDLGDDFEVCNDQTIFLDAFWPGATYQWTDGVTTSNREINEEGIFSVNVSNECGTVSDEVRVTHLFPPEAVDLGQDLTLCEGDSIILDASQPTTFPPVFFRWQDGTEAPIYKVERTQDISVVVSNECGESTDNATFTFTQSATAEIIGDSVLCNGSTEELTLLARSTIDDVDYLWQNGSGESTFLVSDTGLYFVTISNDCSSATDSVRVISRFCECIIEAPTAFTPNDDGINDSFRFFPNCDLRQGTWSIFDRWGNKLYESENITDRWDGTNRQGNLVQEGVYVWVYQYNYLGEGEEQVITNSGTVTVLR
ncbi:MAG: gliding motility-associated C-terminal domain-containing protein [Bacteroidia bacterium]|nr:gliding motility-associated C-terminal domain-containing protein [Bacteroidia bacterium]